MERLFRIKILADLMQSEQRNLVSHQRLAGNPNPAGSQGQAGRLTWLKRPSDLSTDHSITHESHLAGGDSLVADAVIKIQRPPVEGNQVR